MKTFETKEDIKSRILQSLGREWSQKGKTGIDLNSFDPIVDLLISANAHELEKLSHDIANSRNRIFEKLVEILTPDILTSARPAYAIMQANPVENMYITSTHDQVFHKNATLRKDIFFSPLGEYKLFNAHIRYKAFDNLLVETDKAFGVNPLLEASYGKYIHGSTFYIGIETSKITTLDGLGFYFNWKNEIKVNQFLHLLPLAEFSSNGHPLSIKSGLAMEDRDKSTEQDIFDQVGIDQYFEKDIMSAVRPHFIHISDAEFEVQKNLEYYPSALQDIFMEEELEKLTEELLWVKIEFPKALQGYLNQMECFINCIPVVNRQLHEKQEKMGKELHIIPVETNCANFLSIQEVSNDKSVQYKEMPLKIIDDADYGMYALRSRGVKRFDKREASHMINYVMDLVKDESTAFNSLAYGNLEGDLNELNTVFKRLKKNIVHSQSDIENTTFIFLRPFPNDNMVYVKYWTTDGENANRIPSYTKLKLSSNSDLNPTSIGLVSSSSGGRGRLQAVDSINAFKEALLTRGRLVTNEDIKIYCINALGFRNIKDIEIRKGVAVGSTPKQGLTRTLDVHISKKTNSELTEEEWNRLSHETEIRLENLSSGVLPIRILSSTKLLNHA